MRFLLDVDGVALNFIGTILAELELEYSDVPKIDEINTWEIFDKSVSPFTEEHLSHISYLLDKSGYGKTFPLIEGAQAGYKAIKDAGHEIRWITSSWRGCPTWESDRREVLQKYFNTPVFDIGFYHNKWEVSGDFLIDDKPENIIRWKEEQGGRGLLYDQPWNRSAPDTLERFTWDRIHGILKDVRDGKASDDIG